MARTTKQPIRRTRKTESYKSQARKKTVERGLIQFRAPEELVDQLLQLAEHKRTSVSSLVRTLVAEYLGEEMPQVPLQKLTLPNGKVLTKDSYANEIEAALSKYESGRLKLTAREKRTLKIWLLEQTPDELKKKTHPKK